MVKLEIKGIVKHFKHESHKLTALGGVDLNVEDGDFVCLVGPSGCGKSTFLRIVAGLETADEGQESSARTVTNDIFNEIVQSGQRQLANLL